MQPGLLLPGLTAASPAGYRLKLLPSLEELTPPDRRQRHSGEERRAIMKTDTSLVK